MWLRSRASLYVCVRVCLSVQSMHVCVCVCLCARVSECAEYECVCVCVRLCACVSECAEYAYMCVKICASCYSCIHIQHTRCICKQAIASAQQHQSVNKQSNIIDPSKSNPTSSIRQQARVSAQQPIFLI